jgi:N-acetylneuraminic acid mutarotase
MPLTRNDRRAGWSRLLALLVFIVALPAGAEGVVWGAFPDVSRSGHTATLLPNGKVLVTGGESDSSIYYGILDWSDLYDPGRDTWTHVGNMARARMNHTATLLRNGLVIVTGGGGPLGPGDTCEIFNPELNRWTTTDSMASPRAAHTATLLADGRLLVVGGRGLAVVGGYTQSVELASAEIYDPETGRWSAAAQLATSRADHAATLLPNGQVLVTGGTHVFAQLASAELYDPASNTWTVAAPMPASHTTHVAALLPNGKVLVTGGASSGGKVELFDTQLRTWSPGPPLPDTRYTAPTATLLPSGKLLVTGGDPSIGPPITSQIYDPLANTWTSVALFMARDGHTATLMTNGKVLMVGGTNTVPPGLGSVEIYDPGKASWSTGGRFARERYSPSMTLLPDGKVLIAGGHLGGTTDFAMEIYDPATGVVTLAPAMPRGRNYFNAKVLADGKVLMAAGVSDAGYVLSADLFDPQSGQWTAAGNVAIGREAHTTTLLADGRVLVAGGIANSAIHASAEIYDPVANSWARTGDMTVPREFHSATLLHDGRVLIVGGLNDSGPLATSELFDPRTGVFTPGPSMLFARLRHEAVLLPDGRVVVVLGPVLPYFTSTTEIFDPSRNAFQQGPWLQNGRSDGRAVLLSTGDVLVTGGLNIDSSGYVAAAEILAPFSDTPGGPAQPPTQVGNMLVARGQHSATLLPNGTVLIAGGNTASAPTFSFELFDSGRGGAMIARGPAVASPAGPLSLPSAVNVQGHGFTGDSEGAGGGTRQTAMNSPIVELRRLDNDAITLLTPASAWTATSYTSTVLPSLARGWHALRVMADGVAGLASMVSIATAGAGPWPATTSVTGPAGTPVANAAPLALTASVQGASATGSVTFFDGAVTIGGCEAVPLMPAVGASTATCLTTELASGPHEISARYNGDATHLASRSLRYLQQVASPAASSCLIEFELPEYKVNENTVTTIAVNRTGSCPEKGSVWYDTQTIDADLNAFNLQAGTLTWSAGETSSRLLTITIYDNTDTVPVQSFLVRLSLPAGAILGANNSTIVRILDNDNPALAMPGTGTIASNPYGPLTVQGAQLSGSTLSNFSKSATILLGAQAAAPDAVFEIDFESFDIGNGNELTIRAGAPGQNVVLRNVGASAARIAGYVHTEAPFGLSATPTLHLSSPAGFDIRPGGFVFSSQGLIVDALGASWTQGGPIANEGVVWGGTSVAVMGASVTGGGAFVGNAFGLYTFGNANNPVHGAHYLANGLQVYPWGGPVAVTIAAYGNSPQFLNLDINGSATLTMPSAWPAGVNIPGNNKPVLPGEIVGPGTGEPSYGGGSMIVQAAGTLTLLPGASNDFVFPGGIALRSSDVLDVNDVVIDNGWTTSGKAFQGMFFESPKIVNSGGTINVFTNALNWVNFSSYPYARVNAWQLVRQPGGVSRYDAADGVAPHLNTYSTLIETSAAGQCWTCLVNPTAINFP